MSSALPIFATRIEVVEPGTVIRGPCGGQVTVSDTRVAHKGNTIYCTQKVYDSVKERFASGGVISKTPRSEHKFTADRSDMAHRIKTEIGKR